LTRDVDGSNPSGATSPAGDGARWIDQGDGWHECSKCLTWAKDRAAHERACWPAKEAPHWIYGSVTDRCSECSYLVVSWQRAPHAEHEAMCWHAANDSGRDSLMALATSAEERDTFNAKAVPYPPAPAKAEPEALRPCPACGGEARYRTIQHMHIVECQGCMFQVCRHSQRDDAIASWNTRAAPGEDAMVADLRTWWDKVPEWVKGYVLPIGFCWAVNAILDREKAKVPHAR
jgi:hypothetical protein